MGEPNTGSAGTFGMPVVQDEYGRPTAGPRSGPRAADELGALRDMERDVGSLLRVCDEDAARERSAGRYGAPWKPFSRSIAKSLMADGDELEELDKSALARVYVERARRAEACVNACERIDDPAAATALLREVANESPTGIASDENPICWFCGVSELVYMHQPAVQHLDTCLWARIRRAVGLDVPPAAPAWVPVEGEEVDDA